MSSTSSGTGDLTPGEEGVLVLEDEQRRGWLAGAHRIGTVLHDHRSLRLAVLNSCEGARNSRTDPFAGVAATLIRHGIPAVVAMQFEITDEVAITFAGAFYSALAEGFPVDAAVAEARKAIYAQPNDVEWGTPVLYMRSPDGRLFTVEQTSQADKRREGEAEQKQRQAAGLYHQAQAPLNSESWDVAIKKLLSVLELDPAHKDAAVQLREARRQQALSALYDRGRKHYGEKRWHEALDNFRQVQEMAGDYKDVSGLIAVAQSQMIREQTAAAPSPTPGEIPRATRHITESRTIRPVWIVGVLVLLITGGVMVLMKRPSNQSTPPEPVSSEINAKVKQLLVVEAEKLKVTAARTQSQASEALSSCYMAQDKLDRSWLARQDDGQSEKESSKSTFDSKLDVRSIKSMSDKAITTADEAISNADKVYKQADGLLRRIASERFPDEIDTKNLESSVTEVKNVAGEARKLSDNARSCVIDVNDKLDRMFQRAMRR